MSYSIDYKCYADQQAAKLEKVCWNASFLYGLLSPLLLFCDLRVYVNEMKITFLHLAASELFNAVNVVAAAFVEAGHVVSSLFAFTPTPVVERIGDIFIVTVLVTVRVALWMAALSLVNVQ